MIETKEENKVGFTIAFILIIVTLVSIYAANNTRPLRSDDECIEWGVEVEYPNKTKAWAHTSYDPRNREEAEHIAKQMEMEDIMGNRNYTAKCKRYK